MNIALPSGMTEFVQLRVSTVGYGSVSEYVRELIRADQKQSAMAVLESELLKGIQSGPAVRMFAKDWSEIRAEVKKCLPNRKKKS
jgi:antitoxin ParD1/3/4